MRSIPTNGRQKDQRLFALRGLQSLVKCAGLKPIKNGHARIERVVFIFRNPVP